MKIFNLIFSSTSFASQRLVHTTGSIGLILVLFSGLLQATEITLSSNLLSDSQAARSDQKPIVLFVTASDCPYCETLREEVFQFLPNDSRFILREIVMDDAKRKVIDFNGDDTSASLIADQYGVFLSPTVLFVDANGKQLSKPLVGVLTLDFYNYYFDQNITQSTQMIRQQTLSKNAGSTSKEAIN